MLLSDLLERKDHRCDATLVCCKRRRLPRGVSLVALTALLLFLGLRLAEGYAPNNIYCNWYPAISRTALPKCRNEFILKSAREPSGDDSSVDEDQPDQQHQQQQRQHDNNHNNHNHNNINNNALRKGSVTTQPVCSSIPLLGGPSTAANELSHWEPNVPQMRRQEQRRREQLQKSPLEQVLVPRRRPAEWSIHVVEPQQSQSQRVPQFPTTVQALTHQLHKTIVQAWTDTKTSRGVSAAWDPDRLSVELDGLSPVVIRQIALRVAGRLASTPVPKVVKRKRGRPRKVVGNNANAHAQTCPPPHQRRRVAVIFGTVKEALAASHQLGQLRGEEPLEHTSSTAGGGAAVVVDTYSNVTILPLGHDLPWLSAKTTTTTRSRRRSDNENPGGVILVVQPSACNDGAEYPPPGPTPQVLPSLQRLAAKATLAPGEWKMILVAPRLGRVMEDNNDDDKWQRMDTAAAAATLHRPWLMRDFEPPIYTWVAPQTEARRRQQRSMRGARIYNNNNNNNEEENNHNDDDDDDWGLVQSPLEEEGAWHVFGPKTPAAGVDKDDTNHCDTHCSGPTAEKGNRAKESEGLSYEYLASASGRTGRPPRAICQRIRREFVAPA